MATEETSEHDVIALYEALLTAWNSGDVAAFAAGFTTPCSCVGFDGSEYTDPAEMSAQLAAIFRDHQVAHFVWSVRDVRTIAPDTMLLRAVAGMVPPSGGDLMADRYVVHNLVAVLVGDAWRIASYQNTPARYDGRPEAVDDLKRELTAAMAR